MDNAGTLFLVPGEKPMPPVTVRVVAMRVANLAVATSENWRRRIRQRPSRP
jgi:hypothetical protein